jgi:hypothetical protein
MVDSSALEKTVWPILQFQLRVFAVHGESSEGFVAIDDFDLVELVTMP